MGIFWALYKGTEGASILLYYVNSYMLCAAIFLLATSGSRMLRGGIFKKKKKTLKSTSKKKKHTNVVLASIKHPKKGIFELNNFFFPIHENSGHSRNIPSYHSDTSDTRLLKNGFDTINSIQRLLRAFYFFPFKTDNCCRKSVALVISVEPYMILFPGCFYHPKKKIPIARSKFEIRKTKKKIPSNTPASFDIRRNFHLQS